MSRIITEIAVNRFLSFENFSCKNTRVKATDIESFLYLHGNLIARIDQKQGLYINNCGWFTNTTKERLNALPGVSIQQKKFEWFLNGKKWDGTEKRIGNLKRLIKGKQK